MAEFKFPLEKLLNYRYSIEDQRKEKLAYEQQIKRKLEQELEETQKEYAYYLNSGTEKKLDVFMINQKLTYMECLRTEAEKKSQEVKKAGVRVQNCLNDVVEAMKDRKVLEKLKSRQKEMFFKEMNHRENQNLDEIALIRYANLNGSEK